MRVEQVSWDGTYFLHDDLDAYWDHTAKLPITPYVRLMYVATYAIRHFLGPDWIERAIFADSFGFLSARFRTVFVHSLAREIAAMRIIELAEMLLNFQDAPGFKSIVEELNNPKKLAPTFGALEIAGFLTSSGNQVAFRAPKNSGGRSHDFDITTSSGLPVCIEAKCVLKGNETAQATIRSRLRAAASQLPGGRDGAICVRVPEQWLTEGLVKEEFQPVAKELLRNWTRVVSVIMVTSKRTVHENDAANVMLGAEIGNPRSNPDGSRFKLLKPMFRNFRWFFLARYFGLAEDISPEQAEQLTQIFTRDTPIIADNRNGPGKSA